MNRQRKLLLFAVGTLALLALLAALVKAPPDGIERGELSQFFGRFHPLAVHLPIALVLLAAILECAGLFRAGKHLQTSAAFVLSLAASSAIFAVFLGWLLGRNGGYEGPLVLQHMWGGILLAGALLLCCAIREWNSKLYAAALFATVCLLVWTSDQGGKLTHGEGFLTEHMPARLRAMLGVAPPAKRRVAADTPVPTTAVLSTSSLAAPTTRASVAFFASRVEPIFAGKCVQCHGPEKKKGKLRLDTFDYVMRGGKDGAVIKPGDPKNSELLRRINLPRDNKDAMPAEGKPGLTAAEVKVIEFWIAAGAAESLAAEKVTAAPPPLPLKPVLPPLTADYRLRSSQLETLQTRLGIRLVPRSQNPRDGLILRTVGAPELCDDATLAALTPVADLIVDAELARTKITDAGVKTLAGFANLRSVDLSRTAVTSRGLAPLTNLGKLESLNLTATDMDDAGVLPFRRKSGLHHLYLFGTKCTDSSEEPSASLVKK